jgi:hypothetical protein
MSRVIATGLLLLLTGATVLAQEPGRARGRDSVRADIVQKYGKRTEEWLKELRPLSQSVARGRQDQLADSLVRSAVKAAAHETSDYTSVAIVNTLTEAGEPAGLGARPGIPYSGAGGRLTDLLSLAPVSAFATRGAALYGLNRVGAVDALLPLLDSIARSQDLLAGVAVDLLVENASPGERRRTSQAQRERASRLLRAMWDEAVVGTVSTSGRGKPVALDLRREALGGVYQFGLRQGWPKPPTH